MRAARLLGTHTKEEWEALKNEFNHHCVRCLGANVKWRKGIVGGEPDYHLDKDHITPVCLGGDDSISNIQPLCAWCNASKGPEVTNWVKIRRDEVRH
jgi:hypothetical protein